MAERGNWQQLLMAWDARQTKGAPLPQVELVLGSLSVSGAGVGTQQLQGPHPTPRPALISLLLSASVLITNPCDSEKRPVWLQGCSSLSWETGMSCWCLRTRAPAALCTHSEKMYTHLNQPDSGVREFFPTYMYINTNTNTWTYRHTHTPLFLHTCDLAHTGGYVLMHMTFRHVSAYIHKLTNGYT